MRPTDLALLHGVEAPALQPGGDLVAYVVTRQDLDEDRSTSTIHVLDLADGSDRRFTTGDADRAPRWSPDGQRLAFLRAVGPQEPTQLAVLDLQGGEALTITDMPRGVTELAWTPAGDAVVVAGTEWRPGWDDRDDDERARQPRRITELRYRGDDRGEWSPPAAAPNGTLLAVGLADAWAWPRPSRLYRIDAVGELVDLAPDVDRDFLPRPVQLDGGRVLARIEDRGAVHVVAVGPEGDAQVVVGGARTVTGFDAAADGSRIVYTASHPTDPGELWVLEDGEPRVLTAHNHRLRDQLLPVEHFTFERDGVEIDVWAVLPDDSHGGRVPLLVNIHGGPTAQYGHVFFDEFQVEAGAGYAVVGCNPRGSSGRGAEWATAVVGAWVGEGSVDTLDLEAVADAAIARYDRIDPERLGIMGGSYGGYATARILARTQRYSSAIVERGLLTWPSFGGTSDIGAFFDRIFLDRFLRAS